VGVGIPLNTEPNTILGLGFGLGGRAGVSLSNVYAGVAGGPGTCHTFHTGLTLHGQVGVRF
jgi:hypothetical protein